MFKIILQQSKEVLSNENGGPNLEHLIGIGVSLGVTLGLYKLAIGTYNWIGDTIDIVLNYAL